MKKLRFLLLSLLIIIVAGWAYFYTRFLSNDQERKTGRYQVPGYLIIEKRECFISAKK